MEVVINGMYRLVMECKWHAVLIACAPFDTLLTNLFKECYKVNSAAFSTHKNINMHSSLYKEYIASSTHWLGKKCSYKNAGIVL